MSMSRSKVAWVIIITGAIALAADYLSFLPFALCFHLFGDMWMSAVRTWLINAGVPEILVAHYVAFALLELPLWLPLAVGAGCLGFSRRSWATCAAIALACWVPIANFLMDLAHYLLYADVFENMPSTLFIPQIRIVSLFGTIFVLAGWAVGHLVGRTLRPGKTEPAGPTNEPDQP